MAERTGRPFALPVSHTGKPHYKPGDRVGELTCVRIVRGASVIEWKCSCGTTFEKPGYDIKRIARDETRKAPIACQACVARFIGKLFLGQAQRSDEKTRTERSRRGREAMAKSRLGRHCPQCCGLPHRRPRVGLCKCGGSFRSEEVA
jgi:hypothetical protein